MKKYWSGFTAGGLSLASIMLIFQDMLGKEGYSQWMSDHWISPYFSVPLAIVSLLLAVYSIITNRQAAGS
jgi:hypothetical protein